MKNRIKKIFTRLGYYSKPDFIIIGAQKAGTTGLFEILDQHSLIVCSNIKEIHYFDNDQWYLERKLYSYHSYFPFPHNVPKKAKLFEATPIYLFHPEVAERLFNYNPKLKLIILLRNPVERAFSAWTMYHHHFKTGRYKELHDPRNFTEAISEEFEKIDQSDFWNNKIGYVKRGIYHYQIEAFLKYFPVSQVLFIESEELKKEQEKAYANIQSFIGVPYENISLIEANKSEISEKDDYKNDFIKLYEFYKPHNEKLYSIIGREFKWDKEANNQQ